MSKKPWQTPQVTVTHLNVKVDKDPVPSENSVWEKPNFYKLDIRGFTKDGSGSGSFNYTNTINGGHTKIVKHNPGGTVVSTRHDS